MSASGSPATKRYQPRHVDVPPIYQWPPNVGAALRYLFVDMLVPWAFIYVLLSLFTWHYLTPSMSTMATFEPGWIALLWLRNAILLSLLAGGLHWWLHKKRAQEEDYKFEREWRQSNVKRFLFKDQLRDNMVWSLASGVTIWTAYEAITYWVYATGRLAVPEHMGYFVLSIYLLFFWSTINFYGVHRALHWEPVYKHVHELHHRNVNIGPWSGISMHPVEHLLYFSPFVL